MKEQEIQMDSLSNEYKQEVSRPGFLSVVSNSLVSIVVRLDQFFTVSNEERTQAGINLSGEGREDSTCQPDDSQQF